MAGDWKEIRLGDHIDLKGGLSYKGEFVDTGTALLIGMGCVSNTERFLPQGARRYGGKYTKAHLVGPGDLVIATRQQSDNLPILGFPAMIPCSLSGRDVIVGTNLYMLANRSSISNRFLYWLLRGREYRERILECAKGTTVRMLTKDAIEDFRFRCPPASERDAITSILDSLDDKIELNRRMSETLEAMARTLFKSWFVDFDPVRAKMANRDPGLPQALADLFPARLFDSELGEIPEGWKTAQLMDAIEFVDGRTLPSSVRDDEGAFRAFGANGPIARTTQAWVDSPCIVLGKIGSCGALHRSAAPSWVTNNAFAVRAGRSRSLEFAWHSLKSVDFSNYVGGSANPYMPLKNFGHHQIVLPTPQVLAPFQSLAGSLRSRADAAEAQSCFLAALRDTLLPKLISGELRVGDAERFIERMV